MIQVAMLYAPGMLATALHLCGRDGELYDFRGRPEVNDRRLKATALPLSR